MPRKPHRHSVPILIAQANEPKINKKPLTWLNIIDISLYDTIGTRYYE